MDSFKTREILDIVLKQNYEISHLIIDYARNVRMTKTMDIRDKQVITKSGRFSSDRSLTKCDAVTG